MVSINCTGTIRARTPIEATSYSPIRISSLQPTKAHGRSLFFHVEKWIDFLADEAWCQESLSSAYGCLGIGSSPSSVTKHRNVLHCFPGKRMELFQQWWDQQMQCWGNWVRGKRLWWTSYRKNKSLHKSWVTFLNSGQEGSC